LFDLRRLDRALPIQLRGAAHTNSLHAKGCRMIRATQKHSTRNWEEARSILFHSLKSTRRSERFAAAWQKKQKVSPTRFSTTRFPVPQKVDTGTVDKDATEEQGQKTKRKLQAIAALRFRAQRTSSEMIAESLIPSASRQRAFRIVQIGN